MATYTCYEEWQGGMVKADRHSRPRIDIEDVRDVRDWPDEWANARRRYAKLEVRELGVLILHQIGLSASEVGEVIGRKKSAVSAIRRKALRKIYGD